MVKSFLMKRMIINRKKQNYGETLSTGLLFDFRFSFSHPFIDRNIYTIECNIFLNGAKG